MREIDLGMMAGAGLEPGRGLLPPFMQADSDGLDRVLERLEGASERFGERFEPPAILRRLVAQGRLGRAGGQGFYAVSAARRGTADGDGQVRDRRRGASRSPGCEAGR